MRGIGVLTSNHVRREYPPNGTWRVRTGRRHPIGFVGVPHAWAGTVEIAGIALNVLLGVGEFLDHAAPFVQLLVPTQQEQLRPMETLSPRSSGGGAACAALGGCAAIPAGAPVNKHQQLWAKYSPTRHEVQCHRPEKLRLRNQDHQVGGGSLHAVEVCDRRWFSGRRGKFNLGLS